MREIENNMEWTNSEAPVSAPALRIAKVRDVKTPERGTEKSAGIDFFVPNNFKSTLLRPGEDILIPSGIVAKIPENCFLLAQNKTSVVTSRSALLRAGMVPKKGSTKSILSVGCSVVDEDYQGEIYMHVINHGPAIVTVYPGMKLLQLIVLPVIYSPVVEVKRENLFDEVSKRGVGAFGSTNK